MTWKEEIKKETVWLDDDVRSVQWCLAMLEVLRDYGAKLGNQLQRYKKEGNIQRYTKLDADQLADVKAMIITLEKISDKIESSL
jgi:hypothetical protein|tara:strand:+ start:5651 stop:5902 length:252 start_codon:yes stop_codon:yes gene_type:complete